MSAATTLILGSGSDARKVRSSLVDLQALGMTRKFLWADLDNMDSVDNIDTDTEGNLRIRKQSLSQGWRESVADNYFIIYLELAGDTVTNSAYRNYDDIMRRVSDWRAECSRILNQDIPVVRLVVPNLEQPASIQEFQGHTLIVSPEDSETPLSPKDDVTYLNAPHTATAIANLAGLWNTADCAPYLEYIKNSGTVSSAEHARLVRTYHQYVDASAVENEIYQQVFDLDHNLPYPALTNGQHIVNVDDDDRATQFMSETLMHNNAAQFVLPRTPAAYAQNIQVRGFEMLKQFFKFFFQAVIGSPTSWIQSFSATVTQKTAEHIQNLLYGGDSNIEVIVGKHSGRRKSTIQELNDASTKVNAAIKNNHIELAQQDSLSGFWRAYTDTAKTLVDGKERFDSDLRLTLNQIPAIVSDARFSVPAYTEAFDGYHPTLSNVLGGSLPETKIYGFDPEGAKRYQEAINYAASHTTDAGVQKLRQDFGHWQNQAVRSFAWKIGEKITTKVEEARVKAQACSDDLRSIRQHLEQLPDIAAKVKELARKLRIIEIIWFVGMVLLGYLCASCYNAEQSWALSNEFFTWQRTLLFGIVFSVLMLLWQIIVFAKANQGIFSVIEAKKVLSENERIVTEDLKRAIAEVQKTSGAYAQFFAWSAILSRVLTQPFGRQDHKRSLSRVAQSGLPRNTHISTSKASAEEINNAVEHIRAKIYPIGWVEQAYDTIISQALEQSMKRANYGGENVTLYGQSGHNSQLEAVAQACLEDTGVFGHERGMQAWQYGLNFLRTHNSSYEQKISHSALNTDMVRLETGKLNSSFNHKIITSDGVNNGAAEVDPHIRVLARHNVGDSLSESLTVVEYGAFTDLGYFQLAAEQHTDHSRAATALELPSLEATTQNEQSESAATASPVSAQFQTPLPDIADDFDGLI
ncbi:hypothetical protein [Corynebacterium sp. sy039]|uniref:hypothetical protein n=1 Tax=Corynebacterium sp. sy039 TaxID=2599641 RepID=UPI0011B3686E|nr:hypothetical protein [Corynebacterium sp. sy039]QDZ43196.1 hypothetical protein FQV43_08545 [Corynebacterium sp. sy039]